MSARTRPQPAGALDEARSAYRRADFAQAIAILAPLLRRPSSGAPAVLLRAKIALSAREPVEALELVAQHAARFGAPRDAGEAALIAGAAYARLGDERAASAQFKRAAAAATRDAALLAALLYERAFAAWIARRLDDASDALDAFEKLDAEADLRARAAVVRSLVAASRERPAEQGAHLLEALRIIRSDREPPALTWAVVVAQIAYLARELPGNALRDVAFAELGRVPWTPDLAEYRYTMLSAVAWRHALAGDYFNAFRRLKEARAHAPTAAWRVASSCDRAYLATVIGERRWAEQELSDAHELAANVAWNGLAGEERFALWELAELYAERDPALALSYMATYKQSGDRFERTYASNDDRRLDAMQAYSFGVVNAALGGRAEAQRLFGEAWSIYDRIGYDWRAGRVAKALCAATSDDAWCERAREKLAHYARSWLVEPARSGLASPESPEALALTPARRAVYELLLRGLTTAQIAAEQGRSEFTVRNHVKAIFKTFGVTSRPALIARGLGRTSSPQR